MQTCGINYCTWYQRAFHFGRGHKYDVKAQVRRHLVFLVRQRQESEVVFLTWKQQTGQMIKLWFHAFDFRQRVASGCVSLLFEFDRIKKSAPNIQRVQRHASVHVPIVVLTGQETSHDYRQSIFGLEWWICDFSTDDSTFNNSPAPSFRQVKGTPTHQPWLRRQIIMSAKWSSLQWSRLSTRNKGTFKIQSEHERLLTSVFFRVDKGYFVRSHQSMVDETRRYLCCRSNLRLQISIAGQTHATKISSRFIFPSRMWMLPKNASKQNKSFALPVWCFLGF